MICRLYIIQILEKLLSVLTSLEKYVGNDNEIDGYIEMSSEDENNKICYKKYPSY